MLKVARLLEFVQGVLAMLCQQAGGSEMPFLRSPCPKMGTAEQTLYFAGAGAGAKCLKDDVGQFALQLELGNAGRWTEQERC